MARAPQDHAARSYPAPTDDRWQMLPGQVRVGRIFGIEIGLHFSWFIVEEDVNQLPVLEHGRIRGVISRDQILRLVAARAELSM